MGRLFKVGRPLSHQFTNSSPRHQNWGEAKSHGSMNSSFPQGEVGKALHKLFQEVQEGLNHGFFDFSLSCEIISGQKRRFIIKSGKNHQFVIAREELQSLADDS